MLELTQLIIFATFVFAIISFFIARILLIYPNNVLVKSGLTFYSILVVGVWLIPNILLFEQWRGDYSLLNMLFVIPQLITVLFTSYLVRKGWRKSPNK